MPTSVLQALATTIAKKKSVQIIDLGCLDYITNNYENIVSYTTYKILVGISKGTVITAGYRDVEIVIYTATGLRKCIFTKVLYILELTTNLLSTETLRQKGVYYRSDRQYLFIKYTDSEDIVIANVYTHNRLLYLATALIVTALNSRIVIKLQASILIQYLRLSYIHPRKLITIAYKGAIEIVRSRELYCIACIIA